MGQFAGRQSPGRFRYYGNQLSEFISSVSRMRITFSMVFLAAACQGCASIPHSVVMWDGVLAPSVEFRIKVTNKQHTPISKATLTVHRETGELAYGFPIDEFTENATPESDDKGIIVVHHTCKGLECGGSYDVYFGFIRWPLFRDFPELPKIMVSAPGYTPRIMRCDKLGKQLLASDGEPQIVVRPAPDRKGKTRDYEYGVYEMTIVLKKDDAEPPPGN